MTGISKAQKKKFSGNQLETPPDWGAKLESLANLEDLVRKMCNSIATIMRTDMGGIKLGSHFRS